MRDDPAFRSDARAAAVAVGRGAAADTIKVVVPFAAGGPVDTLARLVSSDMQTRLNTEMVIENTRRRAAACWRPSRWRARRPTARRCCSQARARMSSARRCAAGQLSYDPVKSFAPIAFVGAVPMLVIVSPDYPAKTLGRTDRQGQDRQAELRLRRRRIDDAHHRRTDQRGSRHQDHARALQGRRARAQRSARRPHPAPERRPAGAGAAGQERQGARAGAVCRRALAAAAGSADQRRAWLSRAC